MKNLYKISIGIIIVIYLAMLSIFIFKCLEVVDILSLTAIFVALTTGLLAIAISDKKGQSIEFSVLIFGNRNKDKAIYKIAKLPVDLRSKFQKYGAEFYSYRVYFKITNTSKFVLKKPTVTIKVPNSVKQPSQDYQTIEVRSNLFNSRASLQALEYGNTTVLSNSNLPYLHHDETIKIWVRMRLDPSDEKDIVIHVALDSENAEGKNLMFKMSPKEILNASE